MKPILFEPGDYRDLSSDELALLVQAYGKALSALRKNITPLGFSACSLTDNAVHGTDANYRSVWARDGAMTILWSLDLIGDPEIRACQEATLRTLLSHQTVDGQIPASVSLDSGHAEYAGVGGITSIDAGLWVILAVQQFCAAVEDWSLAHEYLDHLQRTMTWLRAHDSNSCGLLEIPEAGDWTDLFARSYHVLYDEVLWYRAQVCFARILEQFDEKERAEDYRKWAIHIRKVILRNFWPSTNRTTDAGHPTFNEVQFGLGDARYLVAEISPFNFSWRCDVLGNLLAFLTDLVDADRALMTFRFLWGVGVNDPAPVKCLYPPVQGGDREWKDYFAVNMLNLPNHYHNGGIWPFIGGLWVRYIHKLAATRDRPGMMGLARRELVSLARLCAMGCVHEWEFNEWHHGATGRPMGKAFQAWSAASFIRACHALHLDPDHIEDHF